MAATAVAMLVPPQPQAHAATVGTLTVMGVMTMGSGIARTCLDGYGGVDTTKCLGPFASPPNAAGLTWSGTAAGAIANGGGKGSDIPAAEFGTFAVTSSGVLRGTCELAFGALSGAIIPNIALGTKTKARSFSAQFVFASNAGTITGVTSKGEALTIAFVAIPIVGSCETKGSKSYTFNGQLTLSRHP